tara:strand:+ start:108 stop:656 length:549 start_codon:yes stop_codon:yes gene_type:complete
MAKDFLNIIERALIMGISDKINSQTATGDDIYVYGQYPETEELKFPAVIVQQVASGHEEKFYGESVTFGADDNTTTTGSGEVYGVAFLVHLFTDKDSEISVTSNKIKDGSSETIIFKQRRLLNWLMLNIANAVMDINWDTYEEDELEVVERRLAQWRDIGYFPNAQWHGATAEFELYFLNLR